MIILGVNAYHGGAAAAVMKNGLVVCAVAEERFTRRKHEGGLPINAIKWCLKECGEKIDLIAVSRNPRINIFKKIITLAQNPALFFHGFKRGINATAINSISKALMDPIGYDVPVINIEHHMAHLAYAFSTSGWDECALLSVDGFGDFVSTAFGKGMKKGIEIKKRVFFPHSLGVFYSAITQFLGFDGYGEEYKVMALAAFGKPRFINEFKKIIWPTVNGFVINPKFFLYTKNGVDMSFGPGTPTVGRLYGDNLRKLLGAPRKREEELTEKHFDIAASLQETTNKIILHLAKEVKKSTGMDKLAMAGGVALNSVANGVLANSGIFKDIWVPSAPADDGTAIGAAAAAALEHGESVINEKNKSPFLGPSYNKQEPRGLPDYTILYGSETEILDKSVDLLSAGKIIGWHEGKMEFGPRALGHRSILADPRDIKNKEKINTIIKKRESFRPFAPMVLKEDVRQYFEMPCDSPNMMFVGKIKKEFANQLEGIKHVDGTARIQTVDKSILPRIASLLTKWRAVSGVSVLLNTSFNENEPIVNTPEEAIACFRRTELDALVFENVIIEKK